MLADAIIGVAYFSEIAPDDFGTLDRAIAALFRLPAGDAWIDSLPPQNEDGSLNYGAELFVDSFVLIVNWTLLPVAMAIMVNNFFIISAATEREEEERRRAAAERQQAVTFPLDPLVENLTRHFVDSADLSVRLQRIFRVPRRRRPLGDEG